MLTCQPLDKLLPAFPWRSGRADMRPVFFNLEGDRPQGEQESGVLPPLLPFIYSFRPPPHSPLFTLSLACPSLLVPHLPLRPPCHISHFYLDHSCRMEVIGNYRVRALLHTIVFCDKLMQQCYALIHTYIF